MSHELAGVIGGGGAAASGNGHAVNGRSPNAAASSSNASASSGTNGASSSQPSPLSSSGGVVVNGLLNGGSSRSRDQSPVNNVINQEPHHPPALSNDELRRVKILNQNMRQLIYKEVKRPGKNHQKLFEMLKRDLHGPRQVRR